MQTSYQNRRNSLFLSVWGQFGDYMITLYYMTSYIYIYTWEFLKMKPSRPYDHRCNGEIFEKSHGSTPFPPWSCNIALGNFLQPFKHINKKYNEFLVETENGFIMTTKGYIMDIMDENTGPNVQRYPKTYTLLRMICLFFVNI